MKHVLALAVAATLVGPAAMAQTTTAPSTTTTPSTAPGAPSATMTLTDQQAKAWVDKVVYSSDDKNVGEVAEIRRDSSGKITQLFADIGGFLGIGEHRVQLMPGQFKLGNDRLVLNLTADQVKALPKVPK